MPQIKLSQFSIEDLMNIGFFTEDGRPTNNMTENLWQQILTELKLHTIPFIDGEKKIMKCRYIKAIQDANGDYLEDDTTQYQRYCTFINSALRDIRRGEITYCYYLHQIRVLLRFHPNLKARFKDYYWEVYL